MLLLDPVLYSTAVLVGFSLLVEWYGEDKSDFNVILANFVLWLENVHE